MVVCHIIAVGAMLKNGKKMMKPGLRAKMSNCKSLESGSRY